MFEVAFYRRNLMTTLLGHKPNRWDAVATLSFIAIAFNLRLLSSADFNAARLFALIKLHLAQMKWPFPKITIKSRKENNSNRNFFFFKKIVARIEIKIGKKFLRAPKLFESRPLQLFKVRPELLVVLQGLCSSFKASK